MADAICSAGSCEFCGCEFRRPSDVMRHCCAAMQEASNRNEFPRLRPGDRIGGHPDDALRRAECAVVRGLAEEYGKGQQCQVTLPDRIEIAVGGVLVTITKAEPHA